MNFRLKMVAWRVLSVVLIVGLLFAAAHWHLDGELRKDGLDPLSCARGVQVPERDAELAALVSHINDLLDRVGKSYHEMADFSARVAHELRLPLTLLRLRLEALAPELPPEVSENLQEEIRQLSQLVERSLLMAKAEGGTLEHEIQPVDLSALLEDFMTATPFSPRRPA